MITKVAIINYGIGNIRSLYNSLKKIEIEAQIIVNPELIYNFDKVFLPGVGSYKDAIDRIKKIGWEEYYSIDYNVIELLKLNQKINAIKEYRHHQIKVLGKECGLKEAKEYVDALQIKLGLNN